MLLMKKKKQTTSILGEIYAVSKDSSILKNAQTINATML